MKQKRKLLITLAIIFTFLVITVGGFFIYVNDYYHADMEAIQSYEPMKKVQIEPGDDGITIFSTENATKGLIFYPGGKVDCDAYQPLMAACAEQDFLCVLVERPFNLAVLNMNAADGIREQFP